MDYRSEAIAKCKRAVVKMGTGVLTSSDGNLDLNVLRDLCGQVCELHDSGLQIVLVTSGAIASGKARLGLSGEALSLELQQASAAVGQSLLMEHYNGFFSRHGKCVAQILLTRQDFEDERCFNNTIATFERLLGMKVIPIVNENDAVATDELDSSKGNDVRLFGDNDTLSSLVAVGIRADVLVALSNVDGLLDENKNAIDIVEKIDPHIERLDSGEKSGRGGMASKLAAMRRVSENSIFGIIANGKSKRIIARIFSGEKTGTLFLKQQEGIQDCSLNAARQAKENGKCIAVSAVEARNTALAAAASLIESNAGRILQANASDVEEAKSSGATPAFLERLSLSQKHVDYLAGTLRKVACQELSSAKIAEWALPNGIVISKERVPLGALLLIFESRPDVVVEASALVIKSGNAIILKGGREAQRTNTILAELLQNGLRQAKLPPGCIQLFAGSREDLGRLLQRNDCIDLVIPRGGESLLNFVKSNSTIPVIFSGGGNCHLYVHEDADLQMACNIAFNAKVQKPSACNSIETLLVHQKAARDFLPLVAARLAKEGVELRCCEASRKILGSRGYETKSACEEDWSKEFSDLILAVKTVSDLSEAINHINRYGTQHSEAIVTSSGKAAKEFSEAVDASCVYWNASTRFTDGGQFGFGAELGISTQKLHVRGPVGLDALFTYKYKITGNGNTRG